jgi:AraC family transcriptional regulator
MSTRSDSPLKRRDGGVSVLEAENNWQKAPPLLPRENGTVPRISLTRWSRIVTDEPLEMSADHVDDAHFITYSVRQADVDFSIGRDVVTDGTVPSNQVLLQGPTWQRRKSIYRTEFDFFRIYFPQKLLAECVETYLGKPARSEIILFSAEFNGDKTIGDLTRTLLNFDDEGGPFGPAFIDGAGLALAARLIGLYSRSGHTALVGDSSSALARWRLRRTLDYIEAHLAQPIYLVDLSEVAGLSRVHFAAQFRAAMGCPPYAYILKRRISRAQHLLADRAIDLAGVALAVGFSSQAHFTTAFKRVTGKTPARWRAEAVA